MNAARAHRIRLRLAAVMVPLLAAAFLGFSPRSVAAGGLSDFLKKGDGKSDQSGKSQPRSGDSTDRRSTPSDDRGSGSPFGDVFRKQERRDPPPVTGGSAPSAGEQRSTPRGGLFDIFRKRSQQRPGGSPPDVPSAGDAPRNPPSAGGGLFDIFRKQGRPQAKRPQGSQQGARPPDIVIYHYYDPWYYPYDRLFYDHYGPWILYRREWTAEPFGYDRYDLYERRAEEALRDIERGWQERKFRLIALHLDSEGTIAVYRDGEFSHTMTAREFRALTLQAFEDIRTLHFRFYDTRMRGDDEVRAEAEHVFIGPDGEERRTTVVYTLRRTGRHWLIRSIDLRTYRRYGSAAPASPRAVRVALASYEPGAHGSVWGGLLAQAAPEGAPPAGQPTPARGATLRVICVSRPVRLADLRSARQPLKAATVTCVVLRSEPGISLVPGSRLTCDVSLHRADDGIGWMVLHRGETRQLDRGVIPAAKLQGMEHGTVRVLVDRVSTPAASVSGERRVTLLAKEQWDYQIVAVATPKALPARPTRTELLISSRAA